MPKRNFEELLLQAIDEGLASLGDSSRHAIYFHLEKNFNIKKREIPRKIEIFAGAIEKIFGVGADYLEILIMKNLYEKVGGDFEINESSNFAFADYTTAAKHSFVKKNKARNMTKEIIRCEEIKIKS